MSSLNVVIAEVRDERERQIKLGYTAEHDDDLEGGKQLAKGAAAYALYATFENDADETVQKLWPWAEVDFKPTNHRRNVVKATAMLIAELQRIDRNTEREQDKSND